MARWSSLDGNILLSATAAAGRSGDAPVIARADRLARNVSSLAGQLKARVDIVVATPILDAVAEDEAGGISLRFRIARIRPDYGRVSGVHP